MEKLIQICTFFVLLLTATAALSDAPLKSRLDLDVDQARTVSDIQKQFRAEIRSVRQRLNRESRKLRRAKSANDSSLIAETELTVNNLTDKMQTLILSQDDRIRTTLNARQLQLFEEYIDERKNMVGSSRDAKSS